MNEALLRAAALGTHDWPEYASYCHAREAGLRESAFLHLENFIKNLESDTIERRRQFSNWLCQRIVQDAHSAHCLLPYPLLERVVMPALSTWRSAEPESSAPARWLGLLLTSRDYAAMRAGLAHALDDGEALLCEALRIDSSDQIARIRLVECRIARLDFNAHHLPQEYLGDPDKDLEVVNEVSTMIAEIGDAEDRARLSGELEYAHGLISDWIDSRNAGVDFLEWRSRHDREFCAVTRVYVYGSE